VRFTDPCRKGVTNLAYEVISKKSGRKYYLHSKTVTLRGTGRQQTIYFFAPDIREGAMDDVPAGMTVVENARTGLPFLKRA
jgi:hypothetical protein